MTAGRAVLAAFHTMMDEAKGLDSEGWRALLDLINESSKGRQFFESIQEALLFQP